MLTIFMQKLDKCRKIILLKPTLTIDIICVEKQLFNTVRQLRKGICMICTVIDIRGDYAYVKYEDTGVVSEVAIALLPFGVDVGDKLKFEDYEFTQI